MQIIDVCVYILAIFGIVLTIFTILEINSYEIKKTSYSKEDNEVNCIIDTKGTNMTDEEKLIKKLKNEDNKECVNSIKPKN